MEVTAKTRDRRIVVVHHGEAKTDHQDEGYKVGKVEPAAMLTSGEAGLDAVPNHQNGGKSPKEVLAHAVEDPKILLHERIDRLQHCIEEVHDLSVVLRFGPHVLRESIATQALGQIAVEGSEILGHLLPHLDREIEVRNVRVSLPFRLQNL